MKDYGRLVVWTDYFDSTLSRSDGRKVAVSAAIKRPTLQELVEAAERLGYRFEATQASHPKRSTAKSGYISIERAKHKTAAVRELAETLAKLRGEKSEKT